MSELDTSRLFFLPSVETPPRNLAQEVQRGGFLFWIGVWPHDSGAQTVRRRAANTCNCLFIESQALTESQ